MRTAYFDCFAGVSGDMIIGALIDLGLDLDQLSERLKSLGLQDYSLNCTRVVRQSLAAAKFNVVCSDSLQPERNLRTIVEIIHRSDLSDRVKQQSVGVFNRLAEAEARAHAATIDAIHFHEVGAVDSIIDVVGAMIGFELLGIGQFCSSPVRTGYGLVESQHGRLPVPAPATAQLLQGVPSYAGDVEGELATPTGVAILATLCESFGPMPAMIIERAGYGAGSRDPERLPNALRIIVGERAQLGAVSEIVIVETNIDDMNPQVFGFVMERAFRLGALDVYTTPVQMKKGRPGTLLTVLCDQATLDALCDMLLTETSSLGVRCYSAARRVLDRRIEPVETPYGTVRVKVALHGDRALHFQPEYDDCARLAADRNVPILEVHTAAVAAYRRKAGSDSA